MPQLLSLRSRARKPQLLSLHATTTEVCAPRAHAPQQEKPLVAWLQARVPQLEKAHAQQRRPNAAKNFKINKLKKKESNSPSFLSMRHSISKHE